MAKLVKDSKNRDCSVLPITEENKGHVRAYAKAYGLDITSRLIGGQRVPCVLVPADKKGQDIQGVQDTIVRSEDKEQKRRVRAERPMIPNGKGKLKRCPTVIPNPDYHGQPGEKKTIKNDCMVCGRRDTCDYWKTQQESIEGAQENAGDGSEVVKEITEKTSAGLMPDDDRFQKAKDEILAMIGDKYPEFHDVFELLLGGESRNSVLKDEKVQEDGITKSNLYNMPKDLKNDMLDLLDRLWYVNIDTDKYRK